jgi:hypothetical protein
LHAPGLSLSLVSISAYLCYPSASFIAIHLSKKKDSTGLFLVRQTPPQRHQVNASFTTFLH